ncbi:MAG: hypothetical protein IJB79_03570 [Candidatus Gastranaerophilales bacterium]|nr:hypothetical protein [Candidatus Gastranaerophilales bacterium]
MSINSPIQYSNLAKGLNHLKNPNAQTGTLLIEVPADLGRAYSGYKRGGVIEGAEKLRKEVMSAAVWLFGIPFFNFLGNLGCEKLLKLPMNIDYSKAKDGRDAIRDSVEYLATGLNPKNLDVSELEKYANKFKIKDVEKTIKNIKGAKQAISISAWLINCFLMGVALPKLNQAITAKKLKKEESIKSQLSTQKHISLEEFKNQTKKNKNISFKGNHGINNIQDIADAFTYGLNSNNTVRLISTDVPMIIGRCATARNKYEALEIGIMDTAAIFFYNFCTGVVENQLRKHVGTPDVNAIVSEYLTKQDNDTLKNAINIAKDKSQKFDLRELFGSEVADEIYKQATHKKYGKINRFVKDEELKNIDKSVRGFLEHLGSFKEIFDGENINFEQVAKIAKKTNIKNSVFFGIGTIASFLGLGILIPKVAYFITKKITGKDGFIGIQEEKK